VEREAWEGFRLLAKRRGLLFIECWNADLDMVTAIARKLP
jgi:hypothetical protein